MDKLVHLLWFNDQLFHLSSRALIDWCRWSQDGGLRISLGSRLCCYLWWSLSFWWSQNKLGKQILSTWVHKQRKKGGSKAHPSGGLWWASAGPNGTGYIGMPSPGPNVTGYIGMFFRRSQCNRLHWDAFRRSQCNRLHWDALPPVPMWPVTLGCLPPVPM